MSIQKQFFFGLLSLCIPLSAIAATHEWSSRYAQGTTEYHIADGHGNNLLISCPMGRDQPIQASLTVSNGLTFKSPANQAAQGEYEMSLIVDGEIFRDPFNTSCGACEDTFVYEFWPALRKANNLYVQTAHDKIRFSTEGINRVVRPLDHLDNTCLTANEALMRAKAHQPMSQKPSLPAGFTLRAIIDDPDGYTNIRSQKNAKSQIVARVVRGEQFYTYRQDGNWWQVRTTQGKVGYMHISRIKLLD